MVLIIMDSILKWQNLFIWILIMLLICLIIGLIVLTLIGYSDEELRIKKFYKWDKSFNSLLIANDTLRRVLKDESYKFIVEKNYKESVTFRRILKKYKLNALNTAYTDYIYNIFEGELVHKLEYKSNCKITHTTYKAFVVISYPYLVMKHLFDF